MRVLVVENYENTGLGQVGAAITEVGGEIDLCKPYRGDALPGDSRDHHALVVLGGGQNALADEAYPYFPALLDLIRDFEARGRAVLGICLGSQLIARAFGGHNRIGGSTEFGWQEVSLTDEASEDGVLGELPDRFPIFQWHDDTFSMPPDGVRLAASSVTGNQAFRIGRATYGFQFHFEADRPLVQHWSEIFAEQIAKKQPGWADRLEEEMAQHGPDADAAGQTIARAWVATI